MTLMNESVKIPIAKRDAIERAWPSSMTASPSIAVPPGDRSLRSESLTNFELTSFLPMLEPNGTLVINQNRSLRCRAN